MIFGFKGDSSKLKNLYKELGLTEKKAEKIEDIEDYVKSAEKTVLINYNDFMVYDDVTADIVEKKAKIMKAIKSCKRDLFLGLVKDDPSLDKVKIDVAICTKVNTKDMDEIKNVYNFINSDLAFNGKLSDDQYAVKLAKDLRPEAMNVSSIKKLLK